MRSWPVSLIAAWQSVRQKRAASAVAGGDETKGAAEEEELREKMEGEKGSYKEVGCTWPIHSAHSVK